MSLIYDEKRNKRSPRKRSKAALLENTQKIKNISQKFFISETILRKSKPLKYIKKKGFL
jgi:hypothetical protein